MEEGEEEEAKKEDSGVGVGGGGGGGAVGVGGGAPVGVGGGAPVGVGGGVFVDDENANLSVISFSISPQTSIVLMLVAESVAGMERKANEGGKALKSFDG